MGDSAEKLGGEVVRMQGTCAMSRRSQDFMPKVMDVFGRYALGTEGL